MTRPFTTSTYLYQHLSALRTLERESPAEYRALVARCRRIRRQAVRV